MRGGAGEQSTATALVGTTKQHTPETAAPGKSRGHRGASLGPKANVADTECTGVAFALEAL